MKRIALAALCCVGGWMTASPVWAAQTEKPAAENQGKTEKKKKAPALKLTAPGGSAETTTERSARLRRECKGRPNAGAC